jgi:hypothetical protein
VCVNVTGYHIPNFYIFHSKTFQNDYIKKYEDNASMAMQPKAWMTGQLFKSWIGHFMKNVRDCGLDISSDCCHLLILDGHDSHVTTNVVKTARNVGLDLLTREKLWCELGAGSGDDGSFFRVFVGTNFVRPITANVDSYDRAYYYSLNFI